MEEEQILARELQDDTETVEHRESQGLESKLGSNGNTTATSKKNIAKPPTAKKSGKPNGDTPNTAKQANLEDWVNNKKQANGLVG